MARVRAGRARPPRLRRAQVALSWTAMSESAREKIAKRWFERLHRSWDQLRVRRPGIYRGVRIDGDAEAPARSPVNRDTEIEHLPDHLEHRRLVRCFRHPRAQGLHAVRYSKLRAPGRREAKSLKIRLFYGGEDQAEVKLVTSHPSPPRRLASIFTLPEGLTFDGLDGYSAVSRGTPKAAVRQPYSRRLRRRRSTETLVR